MTTFGTKIGRRAVIGLAAAAATLGGWTLPAAAVAKAEPDGAASR